MSQNRELASHHQASHGRRFIHVDSRRQHFSHTINSYRRDVENGLV